MILLSELQYLPPIEFFVHLLNSDSLLIEGFENYQKQSYRNRCYVLGSGKVEELSIPVRKKDGRQQIRDVEIDYDQKWLQVHWRTIVSVYGKSPYFEYFEEYFHAVYFKKHKFLFDLNYELLMLCYKLIGCNTKVEITSKFIEVTNEGGSNIKDIRGQIHPKKKSTLEFAEYTQVFGKDFVSNLSIIDLLFCKGKDSLKILKSCQTKLT